MLHTQLIQLVRAKTLHDSLVAKTVGSVGAKTVGTSYGSKHPTPNIASYFFFISSCSVLQEMGAACEQNALQKAYGARARTRKASI